MNEVKLDFDDVMLVPQISDIGSRLEVNLVTKITGMYGKSISGIPIIAANMDGVGTFEINRAIGTYGLFTSICKNTPVKDYFVEADECQNVHTMHGNRIIDQIFVTVGMGNGELEKLRILRNSGIFKTLKINIDVANGYMRKFHDFVMKVRDQEPDSFIIAGTVCTPEGVDALHTYGADLVRVGIGSGAVCLTRQVAGVGYPQFSAIQECSEELELVGRSMTRTKRNIVCDGGCVHPGDFTKAFAAGAKMIMTGTPFAGHNESLIGAINDRFFFAGSSTKMCDPFRDPDSMHYKTVEGRSVALPRRGPISKTIEHILGGIRSGCSYVGARSLEELHEKAKFIRVNHLLNRSVEQYEL
jgi:GMP reductase